MNVFKSGNNGGTAPNTPEEGAVKVMADEFDPVSSLSALGNRNNRSPNTSPMRNKTSGLGRSGRSGAEEEKKESEDVVTKTLAYFDHVCAVPKASDKNPRIPSMAEAATLGIEAASESFPQWGQAPSVEEEEDDDTTTNPSLLSFENSTVEPHSYQSTTATSTGPSPKGRLPKESTTSPLSQDHENFEVVLDPSSLPPGQPVSKRRWPFSKRKLFAGDDDKKDVEAPSRRRQAEDEKKRSSDATVASDAAASAAVATKNREARVQKQRQYEQNLLDVERVEKRRQVLQQLKQEEEEMQQQQLQPPQAVAKKSTVKNVSSGDELANDNHFEVSVTDDNGDTQKVSPKTKSIMKRFIRKCRKLPGKMGGGGKNEHPVQAFREREVVPVPQFSPANDDSLYQDDMFQGSFHQEIETIAEGDEEESEDPNEKTEEPQTGTTTVTMSVASAWNSLFATITSTFDDSQAFLNESAVSSGAVDSSHDSPVDSSVGKPMLAANKSGQSLDTSDLSTLEEPNKNRAWGWKSVKKFQKSAKSLVKPNKSGSSKDIAGPTTPQVKEEPSQVVAADPKPTPLTEKPKATWKALPDPNTGKTYYYHRKTRETTWAKPDEYTKYEHDLQAWKAWKASVVDTAQPNIARSMPDADPPQESVKQEESTSISQTLQRMASWPRSAEKDDAEVEKLPDSSKIQRSTTPRTKPSGIDDVDSKHDEAAGGKKTPASGVEDRKEAPVNLEKKKEIEQLFKMLPGENTSAEQLMKEYSGREDVLLDQLRAKVESRPFDEPDEEDRRTPTRSTRATPPRSPHRFGNRTMTFVSKASANTRSSALTDRTEKVKNTGKGKFLTTPVAETLSTATSLSSRHEDDLRLMEKNSPKRIPSRVPVPRERQLMVEELTDSRISAETYDGNGKVRGRIMRGKLREHVATLDDTIYDGDNDTELDNVTSAYETDTYGTDSVSALSETDTDFLNRKDNFDQARRRALDDAIEREDWDLAAALSEGMRAANMPGGYEKAHSSWNQSELDKFIANNDWTAVKSYIARMREASKKSQRPSNDVIPAPTSVRKGGQPVHMGRMSSSTSKNLGARSQLQHKELLSESSWTSDSQSSYESYDSESET